MRKIDTKQEISEEQKKTDIAWTRNMWGVLTGLLLFAAWVVAGEWKGPFDWREFGSRLFGAFFLGGVAYVSGIVAWTTDTKEKGWVPRAVIVLGVLALHAWVMWQVIFKHVG